MLILSGAPFLMPMAPGAGLLTCLQWRADVLKIAGLVIIAKHFTSQTSSDQDPPPNSGTAT